MATVHVAPACPGRMDLGSGLSAWEQELETALEEKLEY